jgi:tetratricopeptide (TPR) repeat protein
LYSLGERAAALKDYVQGMQMGHQTSIMLLWGKVASRALEELNRIIAANPDLAEAYFLRGMALASISSAKLPEAIDNYTRAIQLEPLPLYYVWRSKALMRLLDFESALDDANRALELAPDNANVLFQRGAVFYRQGNTQQAVVDWRAGLMLNPDYPEAPEILALIQQADAHPSNGQN